jgi:hypothetical protein
VILLVVQIAICTLLVTSSLVAMRGMARALKPNSGFDPRHSILVNVDLHMAGYTSGDSVPIMQRKILDAVEAIPGVESAGLTDSLLLNDTFSVNVFSDDITELMASHAIATPYTFHISPAYLQAEKTALLAGRSFNWRDAMNSPRVVVVNQEFARKVFGSKLATIALGVLGSMGIMLSIAGIFGMAAFSVNKRVRELGIRIALGARRTKILQAALGRTSIVLAVGSMAGLVMGTLASRILALIVYEATPPDPIVLAGVVLTMSLVGLIAASIPARSAVSVDPAILLREE